MLAKNLTRALVAVALAGCGCQPAHAPHRLQGYATWYGPGFEGRRTASGEVFRASGHTAAHRTLPLGSEVDVIRLDEPYRVRVRINDRGPYGDDDLVIDLARGAGEELHMIRKGRVPVELRVIAVPGRR
jgi:rare lipoprotein A